MVFPRFFTREFCPPPKLTTLSIGDRSRRALLSRRQQLCFKDSQRRDCARPAMITPADRLRPRARAGAALLAAVAGLLLLAGSVSHLRPAHVVSASEGASSEDVSVNGAPGPPSPPSSPPSLAKQLLLALEQGPIATDLEQLLEEHPAAPWAGILAQPAREQGYQIRGVDIERILYPGAMLEWSNNMPLLFLMFGNLGSSTPPPTPGRLDTTCLTCPTSEPPTSCEDIENVCSRSAAARQRAPAPSNG